MNFTATALCTQSLPATETSSGRVIGGNSSSPRTLASRAAAVESQREKRLRLILTPLPGFQRPRMERGA